MSLPTVVFVGPAAVCVLAWLGASVWLPRRVFSGGLLLEALTRLAAGSAALSVLTFMLGLAGAFERGVLVGITVALALPGLWVARGLVLRWRRPPAPGRLVLLLLGLVALALLLDVIASAGPPTSADALRYHLGAPRWWLQHGQISDPFWDWRAFSPFATEMLYAHGLALGGGPTANVLGAVFAVLATAAVFGLGRELGAGETLAGALGAALFVLQGIVTWEATSAFVELNVTFFAVLAAWFAVRYARSGATVDALAAGALAGGAAGTKYLGLVAGSVVVGALALPVLVRRRPGLLGGAAGVGVTVAAAWYVRNLIATGNPFYPLLFGGKSWTPASEFGINLLHRYGDRGSLLRLPILPIDLIRHSTAFDNGRYVGTAIFVLALLVPFARRRRAALVVVAAAIVYMVAWSRETEQARFLLPALAALAAVGGAGAVGFGRRHRPVACAVVGIVAAAVGLWAASSVALTRQLLPVAVGAESRGHFVQRLTGTYDAYLEVHRRFPGTIALAQYPFPFHYPGRAFALDYPAFAPDVPKAQWLANLRRYGAEYVLAAQPAADVAELLPVKGCLRQVAVFHARYVISRTRGTSTPLDLHLYSTRACRS